ncbi:GWxTD domain-containing protein [candidate division KSB1 bacterium]|nr:GWxTD domain-containing protein [candidate division KSB1 bacterium]
MKKLVFFAVFLAAIIFSATNSAFASDILNLSLEVRQFRFNQDTTLVEVYYGLAFQTDPSSQKLETVPFVLSLTVLEQQRPIINNIWMTEMQIAAAGEQKDQQVMIDVLRYLLAPGMYDFKIVGKHQSFPDVIDSVIIKDINIRSFRPDKFEMSDIELAQQITPGSSGENDRFHKNKYHVVPNPLNLYSKNNPNVFYYFELYNLSQIKADFFTIRRSIFDNNGLPLAALPAYDKKKRIRSDDIVEVGMFDVSQLPGGRYFLKFSNVDSTGKEFASSATSFYVYNPEIAQPDWNVLPLEQQMAASEIGMLSADDVELAIGSTKYLAAPDEIKLIDNLATEQAKKLFLYRFWQDRDVNKNTPSLESFRELMRRIQYANDNFKMLNTPGWNSDRGRVLIVYGNPSLIQYYPNVSGFREFQAWSYDNVEQGVCFIFGVIGGFGDLRLLHSSRTGEKHNENWLDLLKITTGTTGMTDDMSTGIGQKETYKEIFRRYNLELPRYLR